MAKAPTIVAGAASGNDNYTVSEDQASAGTVTLNVRLNDPARSTLYSLDDGQSADLLTQDGILVPQTSRLGATIAITADGQVSYAFNSPQVQSLAQGQTLQDSFIYAVRLQNGSLVWQTVTVTLTGTNDAPVATADVAAVAEDALTTGSVAGNDADVDNGAVLTFATSGPLPAGFTMAANGSWAFDGSNAAYQSLGVGETQELFVPYSVTDQYGATSGAALILTVTGTNDGPVALASTATVDEDQVAIGRVWGTDVDGDELSYALVGEAPAGFSMAANGVWTLDASHPAYQGLGASDFPQLAIDYVATDPSGASSTATLTVTLRGANDAPVALPSAGETNEDFYAWGFLAGSDADQDARLTYELVGEVPAGFEFSANPAMPGLWQLNTAHADYQWMAQDQTYSLSVGYVVTDQWGASASSTLSVTIRGSNDAPTASAATAAVGEDGLVSGQIIVGDPDANAGLTVSRAQIGFIPGIDLRADGSWNFDAGDYAYQALAQGQTQDVVVNYRVTDEWGASAVSTLTVRVTGANDAPVTTSQWFEAAENLDAIGSLMAFDQDNGARLTFALDGQVPGGFVLTPSGAFYFDGANAAYDHLIYGEVQLVQVPFTVTDEFGAATSSFLMLSVTGRNDVATIGGVLSGSVTEAALGNAGTPTAQGQLTIADPDSPAEWQAVSGSASLGGYGSYTLTTAGAWSYQLDNGNVALGALNAGETLQDYFTVHSADGSSSTVTITIRGANDWTNPATASASFGDPNDAETAEGGWGYPDQVIFGTAGDDNIIANDGNDRIYLGAGNDTAVGFVGADTMFGEAGDDTLYGHWGADYLLGGDGNDILYLGTGNDLASGGIGNDVIYGASGADDFTGNEGDDVLIGGWGRDYTRGGTGADRFVYLDLRDTNDLLEDFAFGVDRLDFSALDADSTATGDQAFVWGGLDPLAHGIWMTQVGTMVTFYADTDGDTQTAEFMVVLDAPVMVPFEQVPASLIF